MNLVKGLRTTDFDDLLSTCLLLNHDLFVLGGEVYFELCKFIPNFLVFERQNFIEIMLFRKVTFFKECLGKIEL